MKGTVISIESNAWTSQSGSSFDKVIFTGENGQQLNALGKPGARSVGQEVDYHFNSQGKPKFGTGEPYRNRNSNSKPSGGYQKQGKNAVTLAEAGQLITRYGVTVAKSMVEVKQAILAENPSGVTEIEALEMARNICISSLIQVSRDYDIHANRVEDGEKF